MSSRTTKRKRKAVDKPDIDEGGDGDGDDDSNWENQNDGDDEADSNTKKRASRRKKNTDVEGGDEVDEDDFLPSHFRRTERGGFAHTNLSKLRISRANRGNEPWNKGRIRSGSDRAKISAGVRARNRAVLLERLKKIGMSEEECEKNKKQVKYIRERVRRTKLLVKKKAEDAQKRMEQEKVWERMTIEMRAAEAAELAAAVRMGDQTSEEEQEEEPEEEDSAEEEENGDNDINNDEASGAESNNQTQTEHSEPENKSRTPRRKRTDRNNRDDPHLALVPTIFTKDIVWDRHLYDSQKNKYHTDRCPEGGPGGLICCEACTASYSSFLSSTCKDMEDQKIAKVGEEVSQLLDFLDSAKERLRTSIRAAKKRPPPLRKYSAPGRKDGFVSVPTNRLKDITADHLLPFGMPIANSETRFRQKEDDNPNGSSERQEDSDDDYDEHGDSDDAET